jgi:hypothetical protein
MVKQKGEDFGAGNVPLMHRVSITEAVREAGISVQAVIDEMRAGKRRAYGYKHGQGFPKRIPAKCFWVPLRAAVPDVDPPMVAVGDAIQGGTNLYAELIKWVDSDYDERTGPALGGEALDPDCEWDVNPATCLDVQENIIYVDYKLGWTNIVVECGLVPPLAKAPTQRGSRGPARGAVARYDEDDRKLFPEIEQLVGQKHMSVSAAALTLADKLQGGGTPKSKAKRLASLYRKTR